MKLTTKQKEIVWLMQEGYPLMVGQNESGSQYYMIASTHNNGVGNTYFRGNIFTALLYDGLIYFDNGSFEYQLTELGESITFKKQPKLSFSQ